MISPMDLVEALERNASGRALALAAAVPGFEPHVEGDVTWFTSASDSGIFNQVHLARFEGGAVAGRVQDLLAALRSRGRPFAWWVGPRAPAGLSAELERQGLALARSLPGMALDLARLRKPRPRPGVTVEEVTGEGGLREWEEAFSALDGASNVLRGESLKPFRLFLGRVDGRPAGVGVLFRHADVAGVYTIVTQEAMRGRGVGTAVTAAVAGAGREAGDRFAVLTATEMGHPLYVRMGFEDVCEVFVYRVGP
ncbi:MAG: GNAT family N-acetyltransferase [Candidatus Dormibacterales bacterium]